PLMPRDTPDAQRFCGFAPLAGRKKVPVHSSRIITRRPLPFATAGAYGGRWMSANQAAPQHTGQDADLVRSGTVKPVKCSGARAGYLPVKLERIPAPSLSNIAVYLRPEGDDKNFTLYRDSAHEFTEHVKERLIASGVEFVYIPMAEQSKFRAQIEHQLVDSMA